MDFKLHKGFQSTATHSCACGSSQNESNNNNHERTGWENIMIHASISAMNGLLACNNRTLTSTGDIAMAAVRMGKALTDELRREISAVSGENEKEI